MYGYIYLTINTINKRMYIGKKQSEQYDPTYYGSGKVIKQAIQKYGIENFNNVILDTKFVEIYDALEEDIKSITGVIESGLFMEYPIEVIH